MSKADTWQNRHDEAWRSPRGNERTIADLIRTLIRMADRYREQYEQAIGEDSYCGPVWLSIAQAAVAWLNTDVGRLDCGKLDSMIRAIAVDHGFTEDLKTRW
jgi:hypothetical protein